MADQHGAFIATTTTSSTPITAVSGPSERT